MMEITTQRGLLAFNPILVGWMQDSHFEGERLRDVLIIMAQNDAVFFKDDSYRVEKRKLREHFSASLKL